MRNNDRKHAAAGILAVLLILACIPVGSAFAYFSDYEKADGSAPAVLAWKTTLTETIENNKDKVITIKNEGETDAIVRAGIFAGDYAVVSEPEGTENWTEEGGWYYKAVLGPGETTSELRVTLSTEDAPEYDFDITVVHESARVCYSSNTEIEKPEGWDFVPAAAKTGGND